MSNKLSAEELRASHSNNHQTKIQNDINHLKNNVKQKANEAADTVKVKANEATIKANDIANKTKATANSLAFDFENHELTLNNNSYDYTLMRHGADLLTFGKITAIEQLCSAAQDFYGAAKSVYLKDAPEALRQLGDAVWHSAIAAGTYQAGEYLQDKAFAAARLSNFVEVSSDTLDTIYTGAQALGAITLVGGMFDTYFNAEHIA